MSQKGSEENLLGIFQEWSEITTPVPSRIIGVKENGCKDNCSQTEACAANASLYVDQGTQTSTHRIVYKYMLVPVLEDSTTVNDLISLTNDNETMGVFVEADTNNNASQEKSSANVKQCILDEKDLVSEGLDILQPTRTNTTNNSICNYHVETELNVTPISSNTTNNQDKAVEQISTDVPCDLSESPSSASESTITSSTGSEVSSTGYLADTESTGGDDHDEDDDQSSPASSSTNTDISMDIAIVSPQASTRNLWNARIPNPTISLSSHYGQQKEAERCRNPTSSGRTNQHKSSPHRKKSRVPTFLNPRTNQDQPRFQHRKPKSSPS